MRPNPSGEGCRVTFFSQNDIRAFVPVRKTRELIW